MLSTTVFVDGITCQACGKIIQKRIGKIGGVLSVNVDIKTGQTVIQSEQAITAEEIEVALMMGTPYTLRKV